MNYFSGGNWTIALPLGHKLIQTRRIIRNKPLKPHRGCFPGMRFLSVPVHFCLMSCSLVLLCLALNTKTHRGLILPIQPMADPVKSLLSVFHLLYVPLSDNADTSWSRVIFNQGQERKKILHFDFKPNFFSNLPFILFKLCFYRTDISIPIFSSHNYSQLFRTRKGRGMLS